MGPEHRNKTYYYKDSLNLSKEYFQKSIKNNSDINMGFYARIYIAKSFDISDEEKAIKSFKKLFPVKVVKKSFN